MTLLRFGCLAALPMLLAGTAVAQVFPTRAEGPVTDDAFLIADANEAALVTRLNALRDSGTAFDVVTLPNMSFYTMGSDLPVYADLLAENFGLTNGTNGAWALMLVFPEDRELRVATGPAFAAHESTVAAIARDVIAPAFQSNAYDSGIVAGVDALVTQVIAPNSPVEAAASPRGSGGNGLYWLLGGMFVAVAAIVALVKRGMRKARLTPRHPVAQATDETQGGGASVL